MQRYSFSVYLKSQLQTRPATLLLQLAGTDAMGCLLLSGQEYYFQGKILRKGHFVFSIPLEIRGKREDCDMLLQQRDGFLQGSLLTSGGCWTVEGTQQPADGSGAAQNPGDQKQ